MKVTTERLEHCQINVFVELDAAEVDEKLRQTARKISRKVNVPGYRRGHAPFAAVIRTFGREVVQQEAIEDFGQELYDAALKQIEAKPYQQGELQDVKWDPFRMTVLIPTQPEVDLGNYGDVRVPFEPEPVTDEQAEKRLEQIQEEHAQWVPVERPAALGDQVVVDVQGKAGGKAVLGEEGYEIVLEEQAREPLPGFHEALVGMAAGEGKTFALTYPKQHSDKELAGKEATFTVQLHAVKQKDLPPLDDQLAIMVGAYDTLDELKAAVRMQLEAEATEKAKPGYLDKVLEAMIQQAVKIDYPTQAVDREAALAVNRMERNLASSGIRLDRYLQMINKTREAYTAELRPAAEEHLKKRLVMVEVAKREGIQVSEDEVEGEVDRLSALLREEAEELKQALASPEGKLSVADDLLMGKVQERIIGIGRGEVSAVEKVEKEGMEGQPEAGVAADQPLSETPVAADEQQEARALEAAEVEPASGAAEEMGVQEPAQPSEAAVQE